MSRAENLISRTEDKVRVKLNLLTPHQSIRPPLTILITQSWCDFLFFLGHVWQKSATKPVFFGFFLAALLPA